MVPVASTTEVLACKVLNRLTGKVWADWACEMLAAGFETEHLVILAGMGQPLEYFEMRPLTDKVLSELGLDYSNKDAAIIAYASYLAGRGLAGEMEPFAVLRRLRGIYMELDGYEPLANFYYLCLAKEDLDYDGVQWYLDGLDRSNIDQAVSDYFKVWLREAKYPEH